MKTKTCTKCRVEKPVSEFYKNTKAKDGLLQQCKTCTKQTQKVYASKNREKILARHKADYRKDKSAWTKKSHGITGEEYDSLKQKLGEEQLNCCAICLRHESQFKKGLHLDHNHKTGRMRGLLCPVCNTRLSHIEDLEFVIKANVYLASHE